MPKELPILKKLPMPTKLLGTFPSLMPLNLLPSALSMKQLWRLLYSSSLPSRQHQLSPGRFFSEMKKTQKLLGDLYQTQQEARMCTPQSGDDDGVKTEGAANHSSPQKGEDGVNSSTTFFSSEIGPAKSEPSGAAADDDPSKRKLDERAVYQC